MNGITLNSELRTFAEMLGRRLNKFDPGSLASSEYTEIAKQRLSQTLGIGTDDPEFEGAWSVVFDLACEGLEDDPAEILPGTTVPTEAELSGIPYRRRLIVVADEFNQTIQDVPVDARTIEEGIRMVEAMSIPKAHFYGFASG